MSKILFAWIEQAIVFDTMDELNQYVEDQKRLAEKRGQAAVQVIRAEPNHNWFFLQIRKPYNKNLMPPRE